MVFVVVKRHDAQVRVVGFQSRAQVVPHEGRFGSSVVLAGFPGSGKLGLVLGWKFGIA